MAETTRTGAGKRGTADRPAEETSRDAARPDTGDRTARIQEDRLGQILLHRGLVTREEIQAATQDDAATDAAARGAPKKGAEAAAALLQRLAEQGAITAGQARRLLEELPSLVGQQIPGYQVLEKLGQGSMGVVFKARQLSMNRLVALKCLHPRWASRPEFLERFTREAHLAARLSHNNIVQAIDVETRGSTPYFVMEYIEGKTMRQMIEAGTPFGERDVLEIGLQIGQALEHAHRRGLIHRDIKPANIMMTPEGIAKLADLGMAREADDAASLRQERGKAVGTPYYMAPEQIEGRHDVDLRADLYSLGATLYHLATGQPPFPSRIVEEVLEGHLHEPLTPPDHLNAQLSMGFNEVIEMLMAKDCDERYASAEELLIDLECLLNGEPPRIARQHRRAASLEDLAAGEEEVEEPAPHSDRTLLILLGSFLGASVLLNLLLLLRVLKG
jgi:serine/threonine-protein kinase